MKFRFVLKLVARDWRSGELRLLLAAALIAVGAVTAISLFVDRLQQALTAEAATFLGADSVIRSSRPIPEAFREAAAAGGLAQVDVISFPSMLFSDDSDDARNQLVSVKAVGRVTRCAACCGSRTNRSDPTGRPIRSLRRVRCGSIRGCSRHWD